MEALVCDFCGAITPRHVPEFELKEANYNVAVKRKKWGKVFGFDTCPDCAEFLFETMKERKEKK